MNEDHVLISEAEFIFVDVETTGLSCIAEHICEIAALRCHQGTIGEHYCTLVRPPKSIPPDVMRIHNISDAMVEASPFFGDVADRFLAFINGSVLCGYNISFDVGFFNAELARCGRPALANTCIDVLKIARELVPSLSKYNLGSVGEHLGFSVKDLHRAYADVCLEVNVFNALRARLEQKDVRFVEQLVERYGL